MLLTDNLYHNNGIDDEFKNETKLILKLVASIRFLKIQLYPNVFDDEIKHKKERTANKCL